MLSHESLSNIFLTNFTMVQHYHWSLSDLDNMIPWEREMYILLLNKWIAAETERKKTGGQ